MTAADRPSAQKMLKPIVPIVLCGGSGARLWPVSRRAHPKQFCDLLEGGTLFKRTLQRLEGLEFAPPFLLTSSEFRFLVAEQMEDAGLTPDRIVIEPHARSTAPAIAAAALRIVEEYYDPILLVLPSDHVIGDVPLFHRAVRDAVKEARKGEFVTFGVIPDRPETGYGYIELAEDPGRKRKPMPFERFIEKPSAERAAEMVEAGNYLWNSGMFLLPAKRLLETFEQEAPEVIDHARAAYMEGRHDLCFYRLGEDAYRGCPSISIDYAIMEQVKGTVVPLDCGWNDLGTWATVWSESEPDGDGVVCSEGALALDCRDTLLRSDDPDMRLIGLGLENVIAVATRDGVLVAAKDRAHEVRRVVDTLKAQNAKQATDFPRVYRPWGWYETIGLGSRFQVKQIVVKEGGQLSLQSHVHRSEHWVVVSGTAKVTLDEDEKLLTENESVYIPLGTVHRLENPGKVPLRLIEVQSGPYLGEDDIVRYEDIYARA
ncbi:MAG: mannose-1-phosphate guanylyltransferase/mannose-6-phosphate isomerase [Pseudomonadota bacterium]